MIDTVIVYELKQNMHLPNGSNEWVRLSSYSYCTTAIADANKMVELGLAVREDLAIQQITYQQVEF